MDKSLQMQVVAQVDQDWAKALDWYGGAGDTAIAVLSVKLASHQISSLTAAEMLSTLNLARLALGELCLRHNEAQCRLAEEGGDGLG